MHDHDDLTKCGPECIPELQGAVTEAEMRANDLARAQVVFRIAADADKAEIAALQEALRAVEAECRCGQRVEHRDEFGNPDYGTIMGCSAASIARNALSPTQETDPEERGSA